MFHILIIYVIHVVSKQPDNEKLEKSYASSLKSVAKTIIGTCVALGVKVEGKTPKEITAEVTEGKWDKKFQ